MEAKKTKSLNDCRESIQHAIIMQESNDRKRSSSFKTAVAHDTITIDYNKLETLKVRKNWSYHLVYKLSEYCYSLRNYFPSTKT